MKIPQVRIRYVVGMNFVSEYVSELIFNGFVLANLFHS